MSTTGGSDAEPERDHVRSRGDDDQTSLLSTRTLLIIVLSGMVGMLGGVSAGIPVGIQVAPVGGTAVGVAVGLITGIAALLVAGGTTAAMLHILVSKVNH
ncbi:MAG: hypothetical protein QOI89_3691 [Solirubrobacteraceae bacterium]|jgi:hypothetical protein|nr:hypothetical protein [Solirubrobacteraceae bacterium]